MPKARISGILLIHSHALVPTASMIMDLVSALENHSCFKVWEVNAYLGFPKALREYEFGVIVLHYSLFGWLPFSLSEEFLEYLGESGNSYKVAFFQDEYRYWPERSELLNRCKVDCVYTCIEPAYFKDTYQRYTKVPRLINYIPGYVSDGMVKWAWEVGKRDGGRGIDIGYRGRQSYHYMGRAAREKHEIGSRFLELASGLGLRMDISSEEGKRIYGKQWLEFLGNCRATLGVEAGVSIVDIDNVIIPRYQRMVAEKAEMDFEEAYEQLLYEYDGKGIYYRTISPRVFEAATVRTCQILFEGRYSEILKQMVHYIPLKKDFSNFDDVIRMYRDESFRRELTENAYRDLIASGKYSYRRFIREFDEGLVRAGIQPEMDSNLEKEVTHRLLKSENSLLVKNIRVKNRQFEELLNKDISLQTQYIEQQRQFQKLLEEHMDLQSRYPNQQRRYNLGYLTSGCVSRLWGRNDNRVHRFLRKVRASLGK